MKDVFNKVDKKMILDAVKNNGEFYGKFGPINEFDLTSMISQLAECRQAGVDVSFDPIKIDGKIYIEAKYTRTKQFYSFEENVSDGEGSPKKGM
jgi:hypothetical protein